MTFSQRLDKTSFKVIRSADDLIEEQRYWLNKTPLERLEALEFLRYQFMKLQNLPSKMDKTFFGINYGK